MKHQPVSFWARSAPPKVSSFFLCIHAQGSHASDQVFRVFFFVFQHKRFLLFTSTVHSTSVYFLLNSAATSELVTPPCTRALQNSVCSPGAGRFYSSETLGGHFDAPLLPPQRANMRLFLQCFVSCHGAPLC